MFRNITVTEFKISYNKKLNPDLVIIYTGFYPTPEYTNLMLIPKIYEVTPNNGIYEFDCIANSPNGYVNQYTEPFVDMEFVWSDPPKDLKGISINGIIVEL